MMYLQQENKFITKAWVIVYLSRDTRCPSDVPQVKQGAVTLGGVGGRLSPEVSR